MSGGSYSYIYSTLKEECSGRMYDEELNDMIRDLCRVLHDLEWWQSCDSSEESYREEVARFKEKWFCGTEGRQERLKGYIDKKCKLMRTELYAMIGIVEEKGENEDANI